MRDRMGDIGAAAAEDMSWRLDMLRATMTPVRFSPIILAGVVLLVPAHRAGARIHVTTNPPGAPAHVECLNPPRCDEWSVAVGPHPDADPTTIINVRRSTRNDIIRLLTVDTASLQGGRIDLRIGLANAKVKQVDVIRTNNSGSGVVDLSQMFLSGSLGEVSEFTHLGTHSTPLRVDGDVLGPIIARGFVDDNWEEWGTVGIVSSGGSLRGDVIVYSSLPTLAARAEVLSGWISLDFSNGLIMRPDGSAVTIGADEWIVGVKGREINARIGGGDSGPDGFVRNFGLLECGVTGGSGDFDGTINAGFIQHVALSTKVIRVLGEMRADVTFLAGLHGHGGTASLNMPAGGLVGRVLVGPDAGIEWEWGAPIFVGTRQFSFADVNVYGDTSASLGGGTIGCVPYSLHRTDCFPIHGEIIDPTSGGARILTNTIAMRHYGPVTWDSADGQPFRVHRRRIGSASEADWQPQDCFVCALDQNDTVVRVSTSRVERLQRGFEYRVARRLREDGSNVLRSNQIYLSTSDDPEVFDYDPLIFRVCSTTPAHSPGDADDSGIVDGHDVDSVLANWGSTACMTYGDADRNGVVNGLDLREAELYLGWEYCVEGGQDLSAQTDGFASMAAEGDAVMHAPMKVTEAVRLMGYEDLVDFAAGFDAMSAPARAAARACLMALMSGE